MTWQIIVPIVGTIIVILFALHRVIHSPKMSGGEEQPTNSPTVLFYEALDKALLELKQLFEEVADSREARSCHKAPELLMKVYAFTVSQTKSDFQLRSDHRQINIIRSTIGLYMRKAWNGRVRNRHKRALLNYIQETWALTSVDSSLPLPTVTLTSVCP